MAFLDVCPVEELPPCSVKIVYAGELAIGVYNLNGEYFGLEDRCSHDDGPLCEGEFDCDEGVAVCPRHGANIDIRSGRPLTLPAVEPVETFRVDVQDGQVKVEVTWCSTTGSAPSCGVSRRRTSGNGPLACRRRSGHGRWLA